MWKVKITSVQAFLISNQKSPHFQEIFYKYYSISQLVPGFRRKMRKNARY